jgi:hypothetical protein
VISTDIALVSLAYHAQAEANQERGEMPCWSYTKRTLKLERRPACAIDVVTPAANELLAQRS